MLLNAMKPKQSFVKKLKTKMFITKMKEKKVCKGIKRSNITKMKFDMYKNCLFDSKNTRETVYNITSKELQLYTVKTNKIALSPYDDKLYLNNNIETTPYGYIKPEKGGEVSSLPFSTVRI